MKSTLAIHKWHHTYGNSIYSKCGIKVPNMYALSEKRKMATYWEYVTCKLCMRKRK